MKKRLAKYIIAFMIGAPCSFVYGAPAPTTLPPDAGTIAGGLGNLGDSEMLPPEKKDVDIDVRNKQPEVEATGPVIPVAGFRITGDLMVAEEELQQAVASFAAQDLNLGQLQQAANAVAAHLHNKGYLVAVAYLPEQEIQDGIVEIRVLVGKYGKVRIENQSRLKTSVAEGLLMNLKAGAVINKQALERSLMILNEVSGVQTQSMLVAGETQGSTDLVVFLFDTPASSTLIGFDNGGNRYTGKSRFNVYNKVNNFSGYGDSLAINGSTSGKKLQDYSFTYQVPVGSSGITAGVMYQNMSYELGEHFASLEAHGKSRSKGGFIEQPLQRSAHFNQSLRLSYTRKSSVDEYDYYSYSAPKHSSFYTLSLSGNSQSQGRHPSNSRYSAGVSWGRVSIDNEDNLLYDGSTSQRNGRFLKYNFSFNKEQYIDKLWNLHLSANVQLAGNKNLDSGEKMPLGGMYGVRAYPQGAVDGDEGYLITAEVRRNLAGPGRQLAFFIDHGGVVLNKKPWTNEDNYQALSGIGLGLIFTNNRDYSVRLDYAWKLSSFQTTSEKDKRGRLWLQGIKRI